MLTEGCQRNTKNLASKFQNNHFGSKCILYPLTRGQGQGGQAGILINISISFLLLLEYDDFPMTSHHTSIVFVPYLLLLSSQVSLEIKASTGKCSECLKVKYWASMLSEVEF